MPRILVVINPNTSEATTRLLVDTARSAAREEDVEVVGVTAAEGPALLADPVALAAAAGPVVAAAGEAARRWEPVALIVAAFGDPGLIEAGLATGLPVIGIGGASVRVASAGGRRFAIATTTSRLEPALRELVAGSGALAEYAGCFLTASPAEELSDPELLHDELREAVLRAHRDGAEAVVIGGGPLSAAAASLAEEFRGRILIVEPVRAAVAEALCAARV